MKRTLLLLVSVVLGASAQLPVFGAHELLYAMTTGNNLISFYSDFPGTVLTSRSISGLQSNEEIRGIDFGLNGQLYGLGSSSRLYTIDPATGLATQVGSGQFSTILNGTYFGVDIVPTGFAVVSDLGQRLLIDISTGVAEVEVSPTYASGDPHFGQTPRIDALAFEMATGNWVVGDSLANSFATIDGLGQLHTFGNAGIDFSQANGLDISLTTRLCYLASPAASSDPAANLYTVRLFTGEVTLLGLIGSPGDNILVRGLTVLPRYMLTVTVVGQGSVTNNPNTADYAPGSTVMLTAIPDAGWAFGNWSGDASGTNNPLSVIMNTNKSITANFIPAAVIVVNTNDTGSGSLRAAVASAATNHLPIIFATNVVGTITLTNSELLITNGITITGPGASVLTISGNGSNHVFDIIGGTNVISGLTLAAGQSPSLKGGEIYNSATLTVSNCTLGGPSYGGPYGAHDGGGIYNDTSGVFTVYDSTFTSHVTSTTVGGNGGGIYNRGMATVERCAFLNNHAELGGNIYNGGTMIVDNSTVWSGLATYGGGIYNTNALAVFNSTIVGNFAVVFDGSNHGGGLYNVSALGNSIVAGNYGTGSAGSAQDVFGAVNSLGYNLIGVTNGSSGWGTKDMTGSLAAPLNPLLGSLQNNGGPTLTLALLPGSPAIDAGRRALGPVSPNTDQRGFLRPVDLPYRTNAAGGDGSDIGAFELSVPRLSIATVATNVLLSWSTNDSGYMLEAKPDLDPSVNWSNVPGTPAIVGDQYTVTNGPAVGNKFYRLRNP